MRVLCAAALLVLSVAQCGRGGGEKSVPRQLGAVNDFTGTLAETSVSSLAASLDAYESETCHQIVVVLIPSLGGEPISLFSERLMNAWEIGHPHLKNGLLLTLALDEGSSRIDTGTGLEKIVRSGAAERILKEEMFPLFKEMRFEEGLQRGLESIMEEGRSISYPAELRPAFCRSG